MADHNLELERLKPWYPGQLGIRGSDNSLGLRTGGGNVYWVGHAAQFATADDNNDGTDPTHPKATIQSALDQCVDGRGDFVVLLPGHYDIIEALSMVKDSVRLVSWDYLRGQAAPSVVIDANGACHCLDVDADEIEIAGIRFANSEGDAEACIRVAVTADTIGTHIHDCLFAVGLHGIYLGVGTEWAQDVLIERCTFMMMDNTAADAAIFMNLTTRCIVQNNFFWSNMAQAAYGVSIANVSQPGTIIRDNDFVFQQAGVGIFRAGTTVDVSMHGNRFSGAGTPITVLADGGDHAVENYVADGAGGALVDATT